MPSVEIRAFVFTDIVGSTRLKKQMPGRDNAERNSHFAEKILRPHRALIDADLEQYEGRIVSTQGDGHFVEFRSPIQAVMWAIEVQKRHNSSPIDTLDGKSLGVKIGIHMGPASADPHQTGNYIGTSVDYAARLVGLAGEGRIIVSEVVATFVREEDISDITLRDHGLKELAGIGEKLVFEVAYDGQDPGPLGPPDDSNSAVLVDALQSLSPSSKPQPVSAVTTMHEPVAGLRIKGYELLEEIGEGGMGKVFKARHMGMGRLCVLKLIKESLLAPGHEEILERFYQEIQVVARLKHPNIIQAYHSSSRDDENHFLVMEYVDGVTLDRLIRQSGKLTVGEACEVVRQASTGLQCIHEHGLVHRDIKPSNLMLADEGDRQIVKILDLGLALLVDEGSGRITQFRQRAMGTAYYMAPEQWTSTSVDIRADIYALGGTFYHLLDGRPPFQDSKFSQEHAHRFVKPSPPQAVEELPRAVWDILQRMLEKNPDRRFREPSEVSAALEEFSQATTSDLIIPARRATPPPRPVAARNTDSDTPTKAMDATQASIVATTPRRKGFRTVAPWIAILAVLLLAVVVVGRIADLRARRVLDSPAHADAATHFLLTMPGMNGGWWFDEIPWFFPEMRQHLLDQLTVSEFTELQTLARQPDVGRFYERLEALCARSLQAEQAGVPVVSDQLSQRFERLRDARPFDEVDPETKEESTWAQVDKLLLEEREDSSNFLPVDWHLSALLNWKLRSSQAAELFAQARDQYHTESKELKALCIADAAVMKQRLRRWRDAGRGFQSARGTVTQIDLAAPLAIFSLAMEAEVRLFDEWKPLDEIPALFSEARAAPFTDALDTDHPLQALLSSREALYYLETWKLNLAEQKAEEAYRKFAQLPDRNRPTNLYFRSRQFRALAYHFLGKADEAQAEFEGLLQFIDDLLAYNTIAEREKPQWRSLKPNLLGRLADVLLFGQGDAAAAAGALDKAAREARRFEGGPKAAYLARIQFKRAIAWALAERIEQAQESIDLAKEVVDALPDEDPRDVFARFQEVANAMLKPPDQRTTALLDVVQQALAETEQDAGRPSRDDMQLLLFVCNYILQQTEGQPDESMDPRIEMTRTLRDQLSIPLRGDGAGYLQRIEEAAGKLIP